MLKTLKTLLHRITPKHLITRLAGFLAEKEMGDVTTFVIETFISIYNIDMKEAEKENPEDYKTFNEFFTRPLKAGQRPLARGQNVIVAPVDGTIAEYGYITYGRLIAAKGQDYSLRTLLGGDERVSAMFEDGNFETIYLAPSNYHRIHMPIAGTLRRIIYIPGKYYSVNPDYVERIEGLFTKNERAVALFDTPAGPMALVFVGATIVGSIGITGVGIISPNKERRVQITDFPDDTAPSYAKGQEIGFFKLGSTVITVFGNNSVTLSPEQKSGSPVKMGTLMGYISENGEADTASENDGTTADTSANSTATQTPQEQQNGGNSFEKNTKSPESEEENPIPKDSSDDEKNSGTDSEEDTKNRPAEEFFTNTNEGSSDDTILKNNGAPVTAPASAEEASQQSDTTDDSDISESPKTQEQKKSSVSEKRETQKRPRKAKSSRKK